MWIKAQIRNTYYHIDLYTTGNKGILLNKEFNLKLFFVNSLES